MLLPRVSTVNLSGSKADSSGALESCEVPGVPGAWAGEWFIEFEKAPSDLNLFAQQLNENMCLQNVYYQDLIDGKILAPLRISVLQKNAFIDYMRSKGKLGGQNKVPRLSNERVIADDLIQYISH